MEVKDVIKHCKSGNQVAQGILFNTYYKQMYNLSMRIIANHHDVEDDFNDDSKIKYNAFANIGYRHNSSKTAKNSNWLGVEFGYLIIKHGNMFENNTFRFGFNWKIGKYVSITPQWYFSGSSSFPSIRIGLGL